MNLVKDVRVEGGRVDVRIELTNPASPAKDQIKRDANALRRGRRETVTVQFGAAAGPASAGPTPPPRKATVLPQVKNVIAVGAGKGGVGKCTVALNLAVGLRRTRASVGLMDGDIYGPSMPTMLGIKGLAAAGPRQQDHAVHHVHGIHAITIGSLVEQDKPLIWRGPMAHGAFKQLLLDNTDWPELDYLIVDLPPGTGDVPLTLCQLLPLTGAVVVATPQQVALDDAVRAVRMFQQLDAPILGLVENMSYFVAPDGTEHDIFGRGGTEQAAQRLGAAVPRRDPDVHRAARQQRRRQPRRQLHRQPEAPAGCPGDRRAEPGRRGQQGGPCNISGPRSATADIESRSSIACRLPSDPGRLPTWHECRLLGGIDSSWLRVRLHSSARIART